MSQIVKAKMLNVMRCPVLYTQFACLSFPEHKRTKQR